MENIIGSFEAKSKFSQILREIQHKDQIIISKNSKPVAVIKSYQSDQNNARKESIKRLREIRKKISLKLDKDDIKNMIDEGKKL